jgi:hypothetical protein
MWQELKFGVEIEFVGGAPEQVELLPGWVMSLDELQIDETGAESGSELKPPPIVWEQRDQIRVMLDRLKAQGATANWSCGLHVHVGLERWGQPVLLPIVETAVSMQEALRGLLRTSDHRMLFCPPVTEAMLHRFRSDPKESAIRHRGRPQSHRCGINAAAWFDIGTVEIRYANGSLNYDEVLRTVELCLRFVAAIGAGRRLPNDSGRLAEELGIPAEGYPTPAAPPQWYRERMWLEETLLPVLAPQALALVKDGEVHHIVPVAEGIMVAVEKPDGSLVRMKFRASAAGWERLGEEAAKSDTDE